MRAGPPNAKPPPPPPTLDHKNTFPIILSLPGVGNMYCQNLPSYFILDISKGVKNLASQQYLFTTGTVF
jgi:hypothetical protein